ncbi:lipoyl(octanoyl) transferase LipB [Alcaligenaceae bacterium CGII-47]|nr:lipoyl(octanoyl) transferase LipB [Alcaligenaceae bacterium CGII-47]
MQYKWLVRPADYQQVWQAMHDFNEARTETTPDEIWLVEHAPVYTLGQAGRPEHIFNPGAIPIVHTNRGGQVTYHGPGQLVLYALVDLRRHHVFVKAYVTMLEEVVLGVLRDLGVAGVCRKPGAPGIYVQQNALLVPNGDGLAKIAALGIKVRRGCAYHGVALNVAMDLQPFSGINPCGFEGLQTVDLAACGVQATVQDVGERLAARFTQDWDRLATNTKKETV